MGGWLQFRKNAKTLIFNFFEIDKGKEKLPDKLFCRGVREDEETKASIGLWINRKNFSPDLRFLKILSDTAEPRGRGRPSPFPSYPLIQKQHLLVRFRGREGRAIRKSPDPISGEVSWPSSALRGSELRARLRRM